jgi:hypothetical protein
VKLIPASEIVDYHSAETWRIMVPPNIMMARAIVLRWMKVLPESMLGHVGFLCPRWNSHEQTG